MKRLNWQIVLGLALSDWLETQGWPAVHHSAGYREANWPAYRVVARATLRESTDSRRV